MQLSIYKAIRLWARDFYRVKVDEGAQKSSANNLIDVV